MVKRVHEPIFSFQKDNTDIFIRVTDILSLDVYTRDRHL